MSATERICEQCGNSFTPNAPHQRFDYDECRYMHWLEQQCEPPSQRVDGGVGSRGGNVRSVDEARQLQTASKSLDRWRLVMEVQIHRTLLGTGRFHVDDLDCLDLPPEAFEVRGTLVNAVRASGVMQSTGVTRKVAHKAANARKAPIYEITPKGKEQLPTLVGSSSGTSGGTGATTARSGQEQEIAGTGSDNSEGITPTPMGALDRPDGQPDPSLGAESSFAATSGDQAGVGSSLKRKCEEAPPPTLTAGTGSPEPLQLDDARRRAPSMYNPIEDAAA